MNCFPFLIGALPKKTVWMELFVITHIFGPSSHFLWARHRLEMGSHPFWVDKNPQSDSILEKSMKFTVRILLFFIICKITNMIQNHRSKTPGFQDHKHDLRSSFLYRYPEVHSFKIEEYEFQNVFS
jgi:hypothetical protein